MAKTCMECYHFKLHTGSRGYGPEGGYEISIYCAKKHWGLNNNETTELEFRQMLKKARNCHDIEDYEKRAAKNLKGDDGFCPVCNADWVKTPADKIPWKDPITGLPIYDLNDEPEIEYIKCKCGSKWDYLHKELVFEGRKKEK